MKRASFLRSLIAIPFAGLALPKKAESTVWDGKPESLLDVANAIMQMDSGITVVYAHAEMWVGVFDSQLWCLTVRDEYGVTVTKQMMTSPGGELYSLAQKFKECGRDILYVRCNNDNDLYVARMREVRAGGR